MELDWVRKAKGKFTNWISELSFWNMSFQFNKSRWVTLPDIVLIEVFKYLSDMDRAKAALVCTRWGRIFESPCLWRKRHFDMGGFRAQLSGMKACKFADRFGQYLRYLSISCSHPSFHTCKTFQKAIEDLFSKFKDEGTQLVEFELSRLELDRFWKYDTPREKLIGLFSKFLKSQKAVHCFDMSSGQFPTFGGCRVLDSIAHLSGDTVQDMLIEDFFHSRLAVFQVKKYQKCISKFTNIKYLALNYNCISEEIIEIFTNNLARKLEFLNIKVFRNDPHFHRISGFAWKQLSRACPSMRVAFWFESVGNSTEVIPLLAREVPVKDIHLWTGYDDDANWRLNDTVDHITDSYSNTLESLSLELDNNHEFVDQGILKLLNTCKKLRELTINAVLLISTIEDICELQRERKIDLNLLHVTSCGMSDVDWAELQYLREVYQPMIEERGLNFRLTTDLLIEPEQPL